MVFNIPAHLPKRLTISFPIWGLMDTTEGGAYHDLDRMVQEHVERGFNCIRLESGAGLTHDLDGNRLPPFQIHAPFGPYSDNRQMFVCGGEGRCDLMQRLIDLCIACKKHNVYLILSSWYYLHTYWFCDDSINARLYEQLPPEERFLAFAKFLHYILRELEERGLDDRIAVAEIFNEVCDLPTLWSRAGADRDTLLAFFREKHEEALAFLQREHPQILFACDYTTWMSRMSLFPRNMQAYNGHNYFLWDIYADTLESKTDSGIQFLLGRVTDEDIVRARDGRFPNLSPDWTNRLRRCHDVKPEKIPAMEAAIERRLDENWDSYTEKLEESIRGYQALMEAFPGIPVLCGEGVTYCSHKAVLWEEKSDRFWEMVTLAMKRYKEIGLWGTVIKTCCGPEDPCWTLCKDRLRELNEMFLREDESTKETD